MTALLETGYGTPEYDAAHRRVVNLWGKASQYPCVKCAGQAKDWAYDWADPSSRECYSYFPEFYMPLCRGCHRTYDRVDCYAVIKNVRRYTPGDQPFLKPFFIPPVVPPRPPKPRAIKPRRPKKPPSPRRPKTMAEWDAYFAARKR